MASNKSVSVIVRTTADLRDSFHSVCDSLGSTSSNELRVFMEKFIAEHGQVDFVKEENKGKKRVR